MVWWYLASQCYLLPFAMLGPNWALWPNAADLVCGCAGLMFLLRRRSNPGPPAPVEAVRRWAWAMAVLAGASLVFVGWALPTAFTHLGADGEALEFGCFQIYRLIQFAVIVDCASRFRWNNERRRSLHRITTIALVVNCAAIVATFFKVVSPAFYAPQLTADPNVGGPWAFYHWTTDGWGVVGYSHAYTSMEVFMLTALWIALSDQRQSEYVYLIVSASTVVILFSRSRAGLATIVLYAAFLWLQRPVVAVIVGCLLIPLMVVALPLLGSSSEELQDMLQRQSGVLDATNTENLSGRDEIWQRWLAEIQEKPQQWLLGAGFGATSGDSAHMQPLHMLIEVGLLGVFCFAAMLYQILCSLSFREAGPKPIFWALLAIFPSLMTQETLYPVHALGHFCGLTLIAIVLSLHRTVAPSVIPAPQPMQRR
ncbi:MAG: O-antigen ligase family protein [Planctomycetaceae bacterium]|nr:O-antigen ligase family protein [Planctomycetaceae bacterium]